MAENPTEEELRKWNRYFGVEGNNRAWRLTEQETRTPAEAEEMLQAAHTAAWHWSMVGTELNRARADMLLGRVYTLLGNAEQAMRYARSSFDFVTSRETPDWELAFANAVLAHAAAVSQDHALHSLHYARADELSAALGAEDLTIYHATFRHIPPPV